MNQKGRRMEGRIPDQQRIVQTLSDILWTVQLTGNFSIDDKQYFSRTTSWRSISELHGRLRDTSKNNGKTRRTNNQILEDSREAQSVFQKIEMRLQHEGNPYLRSGYWQRTNSNGTRKDQGSERIEDTNKSKGRGKLPRIHKFLLILYTKLQSHCQAIKQTKRQEKVEMGKETSKSVWRTQREDHKSTGIGIT